jgi:hypothetical protein
MLRSRKITSAKIIEIEAIVEQIKQALWSRRRTKGKGNQIEGSG